MLRHYRHIQPHQDDVLSSGCYTPDLLTVVVSQTENTHTKKKKKKQGGTFSKTAKTAAIETIANNITSPIGTQENDYKAQNARLITGMSDGELQDARHEVESILSAESIAFLRSRNRAARQKQQNNTMHDNDNADDAGNSTGALTEMTKKPPSDVKSAGAGVHLHVLESNAEVAASEDPLRNKAVEVDETSNLRNDLFVNKEETTTVMDESSSSSLIELSEIASLLRSSVPRQRLLTAQCLDRHYLHQ